MVTVRANGVQLASPVEISIGDEIIWSSNTGRSTTGKMIGDVVAEKKTMNIRWGIIPYSQYKIIKNNLKTGFYPFVVAIDNETISITAYRGTLSGNLIYAGGEAFMKDVSVSVIQQ